jgi:FKBP-type peptidyl-prolyl cis-trans isomerase FklB
MPVIGTVEGFMTAIQYMVKGDDWDVYIPQQLAYKETASDAVPAYSTLLYRLRIELVHKSGTGMPGWR